MSLFNTLGSDNIMKHGDLVIIYMNPEDLASTTLQAGGVFHNRLGRFTHDEIIGKPFGSSWISGEGKQVWVLKPTAELWTRALPHRTQILYHPDISFISEMLELRPGSVVIESGTGSGSFSHSIARIIGPSGHLHTFEFHPVRAEKAREEFSAHGIGSFVTVYHQDVCKDGFAGKQDIADAVFLDLPAPWEAIRHAKAALKKDKVTRICCFSPCAEQVQRTCVALREHGFHEIKMYEALLREHNVIKQEFKQLEGLQQVAPSIDQNDSSAVKKAANESNPSSGVLVSRPVENMRGHTSYLTFASLIPPHPSTTS